MGALIASLERPAGRWLWLALLALVVLVISPAGPSADLRAMWLAGVYLEAGAVYPPNADVFTMTPPPEWAEGRAGETLYPYLYPPLWAALAEMLSQITTFETVSAVARVLNVAMLIGCTALAWSLTGRRLPFAVFTGLGTLCLTQTFVGAIALSENQPQIAVSFLVLLALERARHDQDGWAGAALALAAALKVYPVLFVLPWVFLGRRRALASFAVTGGGLAILSVALTGWPLHQEFLDQLSTISASILLTPLSYALAPALAQIAAPGALTYQAAAHGGGWLVMPLPPELQVLARIALLGAVLAICVFMRRADSGTRNAALWPLLLIVVSLLSPLSWAYHYIPAVACAPALVTRFGARVGGLLIIAALLPACMPFVGLYFEAGGTGLSIQMGGTLGMVILAIAFLRAAMSPVQVPRPA